MTDEPTSEPTTGPTPEGPADGAPTERSPVTVYGRPGCMLCSGLERGLERWGVPFERVNIWDDPEAAAFVRSVADGSETVPTVVVDDLALVNPSTRDVLRVVAERAPEVLPEAAREDLARPPSRLGQVLGKVLGGG
jgi:mycoredoxin